MTNRQSMRIDEDGELLDGLFCVYCGEINDVGADTCEYCGVYIADQGPDLSARLHRISRHASTVHKQINDRPSTDLIGSDKDYPTRSVFRRIKLSQSAEFWHELMNLIILFVVSILLGLIIIHLLR
jgi:hypothetical protein